MKIVSEWDSEYDSDVILSSVKVEYCQSLDSCQSENDYPTEMEQHLYLETDDAGGGKFMRFRTGKAGWSISEVDELITIFNDFKKRFECES